MSNPVFTSSMAASLELISVELDQMHLLVTLALGHGELTAQQQDTLFSQLADNIADMQARCRRIELEVEEAEHESH